MRGRGLSLAGLRRSTPRCSISEHRGVLLRTRGSVASSYLQALGNEVLPGLYENLPPYTKQPPLQSTKVSPVAHSPAELAPEQPMHICVPVLLTVLQSQQPPTLQTRDSTGSCSIGDVSE